MQQIHVKRYAQPQAVGYQGSIEPEDRSWLLFIDAAGAPSLFTRAEVTGADGKADHAYVPAEAPHA